MYAAWQPMSTSTEDTMLKRPRRDQRLQVRLSLEEFRSLDRLAKIQDVPAAQIIRLALKTLLAAQGQLR